MAGRAKAGSKGTGPKGQALKDFRRDVAALKRKGIVSPRVDARSQKATRYMMSKVRKYRDVLEDKAIAVKAPKAVRDKYAEKNALEVRGQYLIAEKEFENQRARLRKGLVEVVRPLKNGREEYVILPFRPVDMPELVQRLKTDPTLDGLKRGDESFSFRMFGHNSRRGFPNIEELAEYIEQNYQHLFTEGASEDAVKHITLQRFKMREWDIERNPNRSTEPKLSKYMKINANGRNYQPTPEFKRKKNADKVARQRANETPAARAKRLKANAIRTAQYKQRKFFDK